MDAVRVAGGVEATLDPADWEPVRALAHRIIDDAVDHLRDVRERPVWQEMPAAVREGFAAPLPCVPTPLEAVYGQVVETRSAERRVRQECVSTCRSRW